MDFSYSTAELDFRTEVRDWIKKNIPGDFGTAKWPKPEDPKQLKDVTFAWMKKLHDGRWTGIDWPKEYGGRSATPIENFIFMEEMADHVTPSPFHTIGVGMAGP